MSNTHITHQPLQIQWESWKEVFWSKILALNLHICSNTLSQPPTVRSQHGESCRSCKRSNYTRYAPLSQTLRIFRASFHTLLWNVRFYRRWSMKPSCDPSPLAKCEPNMTVGRNQKISKRAVHVRIIMEMWEREKEYQRY